MAREGCKGNGNNNVRVAGNKEGKGSKAMKKQGWQQGWQASGVQRQQRGRKKSTDELTDSRQICKCWDTLICRG